MAAACGRLFACRVLRSLPVYHPVCSCHPPLFTVNPNIEAHDALVHVALYLRCAYDTGIKALDHLRDEGRGMYWSSLHSLEMAEGLVEAMLDGIESAPVADRPVG